MYNVIGSDGSTYGPVGIEELRQWAREGRLVAATTVIELASGRRLRAGEIPELRDVLGPMPQAPPPHAAPSDGPGPSMTSAIVLAVVSMVCCGCLPLGVVSLVYAISASNLSARGDIAAAREAEGRSRNWAYASIAIAIILMALAMMQRMSGTHSAGTWG